MEESVSKDKEDLRAKLRTRMKNLRNSSSRRMDIKPGGVDPSTLMNRKMKRKMRRKNGAPLFEELEKRGQKLTDGQKEQLQQLLFSPSSGQGK